MTKLEVVQRRSGYQPATPKVEDHSVIYRYDWPKLHLLVPLLVANLIINLTDSLLQLREQGTV